jgi:hypothetical protein
MATAISQIKTPFRKRGERPQAGLLRLARHSHQICPTLQDLYQKVGICQYNRMKTALSSRRGFPEECRGG